MSKPVVVAVPHHLGKQEAVRRIRDGIVHLRTTQANKVSILEENWEGDSLAFKIGAVGQTVSGTIDVAEDQVTCTVQLPWVLAMLAEKARGLIQKEGNLLLLEKK